MTPGPPLPGRPPPAAVAPRGLREVELTGTTAQLLTLSGDQRNSWLVLDDVPPEGAPARAVVRLRRRQAKQVAAALAEAGYQVTPVAVDHDGFRQFVDAPASDGQRAASSAAASRPEAGRRSGRTSSDILDGITGFLEPGETFIGGCDGKVTAKVPFLHNSSTPDIFHPHFVALTSRRVMVFVLSPKRFTRGLLEAPLLMRAVPRSEVSVVGYQRGRAATTLDLVFADGQVMPFETRFGAMAAKIVAQLPETPAAAAGAAGLAPRRRRKSSHKILAGFAILLGLSLLVDGLYAHVTVDRAQIVRAYYQDSTSGGYSVLDFADVSGPGAANVSTSVHNAGVAYTLARQSRLPLAVQIRVQDGSITAVDIDGGWRNVWTISHTTELVLGAVSLVLGALLIVWPWFRRTGKSSTARPGK